MHAIRGPPAEHQLSLCMIAMRSLATMYSNAEWVRNIFQALGRKKNVAAHTAVSTRASSPQPVFIRDDSEISHLSSMPLTASTSRDATRNDTWAIPTIAARTVDGQPDSLAPTAQQLWLIQENRGTSFPSFTGNTATNSTVPLDVLSIDPLNFSHLHPDLEYYWEDFVRSENVFPNQYMLDRLSGG